MMRLPQRLILILAMLSLATLHAEPGGQARELQNTFHQIYEKYQDSVVFIATERTVRVQSDPLMQHFFGQRTPQTQRQQGMGTGFVISEDGYVCTNHHVVAGFDRVRVRIHEREYEAKIVGSDALTDIALLKIEGAKGLKPVQFGDSSKVQVGDWAVAIGNPFGLDRTFTVGVISAVARRGVDDMGMDHLQTDASINPGNSGGPLINLDGEVVGMNRMIFSQTGGNLGIGFAIPVNRVREIVDQLRQKGKIVRGFIGIRIAPLTPEMIKEGNLPIETGLFVAGVFQNGPAGKAGIRPGDVIYAMDGRPLSDPEDLIRSVMAMPPGKSVRFAVIRGQKKLSVLVHVGQRPEK
ncbi:S1C family serine protease [Leptonema illini]|uniref:Peptidase S1 and S6 chymotrypsin/Hap n=1 Tax=Leptonema illini DSM 21528 TaxID=929563 RepID=H2CBR0_9LEPT|nr:trypsin-like peptidase domain-containing protein [Leptonema illini]EHQ08514.1 peptidase S1 and S6 chymotrypsin/Hap [Leptonema illini DSM 21528]